MKILANLLKRLVGASGFEPPTSWSRTRRSSQAEPRPEAYCGCCAYCVLTVYDGMGFAATCVVGRFQVVGANRVQRF